MLDIKLVEIGYFLSRCGIEKPPKKLNCTNWKDAYKCFYKKLHNGKTEKEFNNSLKNIRDHFDSYLRNSRRGWHDDNGNPDKLPEQYLFILNYLEKLDDDSLWEYIKPYAILSTNDLYWKFDLSTFRLLGRELITDRITALVELVKNSYDANAKNVYLEFSNTFSNKESKLIIRDDGFGMSFNDIRDKWMTIGTDSKRINKFTPKPFSRRVVGEKGIGRFAIDKLGLNCKIYSKTKSEKQLNLLSINWKEYETNATTNEFNQVKNKLKSKGFDKRCSGVKIEIRHLHSIWTKEDIDRAYKELSKLVSPFNQLYPPFNIFISSSDYDKYKYLTLVENDSIKYSTESFELKSDIEKNIQETVVFDKDKLVKRNKEIFSFGPIRFNLYYFNQVAKSQFTKGTKLNIEQQIDGIKIYRDGVLTTPFAENESHQDKKRDVLGIDKRRYSGFFDRLSSRDIIGIVEITKDFSPNIIDSTNRQDFLETADYNELKDFIISQVHELEKYLKYKKKINTDILDDDLREAKDNLENFTGEIQVLKKDIESKSNINVEQKLKELEKKAIDASIAIKKGIKQHQIERDESEQKEKMFMSLMSLQTYALEITHIIKTSLGHIKRRAEFNYDYYDDLDSKEDIKIYNEEIIYEIDKLSKAIEFMSTYTRSEKNWQPFNIQDAIHGVFKSYQPIFAKSIIRTEIDIQNNVIIDYNIYLFEDIIKNLINNSIKALEKIKNDKLIKITGYIEEDALILTFSDNGIGIPKKLKEKIYDIYYTTTSEDGGNGMGLYMVKTNLEAIKGSIELITSELDIGATFKIIFPFKKDNNEE